MEDEENLVSPHICPPNKNISINEIRVVMNEIFEKEDDGWEAWAQLNDWLNNSLPNKAYTGLAGTVANNSEGNQPASR